MHGDINKDLIIKSISQALDQSIKRVSLKPISGGSISQAFKMESSVGDFFIKVNSGPSAWKMFKTELKGLKLLGIMSQFTIPNVITNFNDGGTSYVITDYIDSAPKSKNYWYDLAIYLAELHQHSSSKFGLDDDNYIGSLLQKNTYSLDWPSFYTEMRILPMLVLAFERGLIDRTFLKMVEAVLPQITNLMPPEPPSLIHGDLWSGNLMVDKNGNPVLVDPAAYYGHREMEIAFTRLFGGFSAKFYERYNEIMPLEVDFGNRVDLYNLYPLLVHLNLFGRGYFAQIKDIIARFV